MKFREVAIVDELYSEIRYNQNTTGKDLGIEKGTPNMDKRNGAVLSIFSAMTVSHHYERAEREVEDDGTVVVYTEVTDLNNAKVALETAFPGITFEIDEISYFSKDNVTLQGEDKEKFERLLEMIEDIDDVSNVYHNVVL